MQIETDSESIEPIEDMVMTGSEAEAASASLVAAIDSFEAPNGRRYPGEATFGRVPNGYPVQTMKRTYFHYYSFDPASMQAISYLYQHDGEDPVTAEQYNEWIADARTKRARGEPSIDPDDVSWDGPAYLAFVMDVPGWSYFEANEGNTCVNKSLCFDKVTLRKHGKDVEHRKNTTFFNAITLPHKDPDGADLPILRVENHNFKYGERRPREIRDRDQADHYKFDIYYRVGLTSSRAGEDEGRALTFVLDPTGKNTGP